MGAHPTACYPFYAYDRRHTALYYEAARKGAGTFSVEYLAVFVHGVRRPRRLSGADRRRSDPRASRLLARRTRSLETALPATRRWHDDKLHPGRDDDRGARPHDRGRNAGLPRIWVAPDPARHACR